MPEIDLNLSEAEVRRVLPHWDVGDFLGLPGERGGTANPAVAIDTAAGRFFLKRRNPRYSSPEQLRHDHALMEHLAGEVVCTPLASRSRDGRRWVEVDGGVYELYPYMPGQAHDSASRKQVREAGRVLAQFHEAAAAFRPPPGKEWPRYHDPALTIQALEWALAELAGCVETTPAGREPAEAAEEVGRLLALARELAGAFTDEQYAVFPHTLIHGDWHPANVKYGGDGICGIFDLDWATRQPRLVDVADGIIFFAGRRASPLDASNIRSLTQPFRLATQWTNVFLEGYETGASLAPAERAALPRFLVARWLYCRADPMKRKIQREDAVDYLLDGVWGPIRQINEMGPIHDFRCEIPPQHAG